MDFKSYPILYVDDDNANRIVIKHNLGHEFALLIAESAQDALDVLAQQPVAVLLSDQRMPGMTGVDLAERVLELYPEVVRVIITAYSDLEATIDAINRAHVSRFIKKPWTREELVAVMLQDDVRALLQGNLSPRDVKEHLRNVQEALDDLATGVSNLSAVSSSLLQSLRTARGPKEPLEVRKVVESALSITRSSIISCARLELDLPEGPLELVGSEGRLLQLMVNLLLNAVQAITPGSPMKNRIGIRVATTAERITISVDDTGCGVTAENLAKLFIPFFTTKGSAGTGLGLAICKQIAEEMQGTIQVESQPGAGARFVASFPRPTSAT
jgi:signal transduction histidine kinase